MGPKKVPVKSAERVKLYRSRRHAADSAFASSESRRVETLRKNRVSKMGPAQLKEYRRKVAERKRQSRLARRHDTEEGPGTSIGGPAYQTPQTLGKAIRKSLW